MFPPEVCRLVALGASPETASRLRRTCHILHNLITTNDLFIAKVRHHASYPDALCRAIMSNWPGIGGLDIFADGCRTSTRTKSVDIMAVCWKDTHVDWLEEAVELLLSLGSQPCSAAVQAASARGHDGILRRVLECRSDHTADPLLQIDALQVATANGQLDTVKALLKAGVDVHACEEMALRIACAQGYSDILHELLAGGANLQQATLSAIHAAQETPLQLAALAGHFRAVRTIICSGVAVTSDPAALRLAAENGHRKVVRLLMDYGGKANGDILVSAVKGGHATIVADMIDAGVDMSFNDGAPLRLATGMGRLNVVKLLISRGLRIDGRTMKTALQEASFSGHQDVVAFLLDLGADNAQKDSALLVAASQGHPGTVRQLIEAGGDVSRWGIEALLTAIQRSHISVIRVLLKAGANPLARRGMLLNRAAELGNKA